MSNAPRTSAVRRDWGAPDDSCVILHVDMDSFYVSVEVADNPDLRGRKIIVGGRERSVVVCASYEARADGVRAAMPMTQAKRMCPDALVIAPRMDRYREVSRRVMEILQDVTPTLEQVSVDEAYLDVTGVRRHWQDAADIARHIRAQVQQELGVSCSIGVGHSKLISKLASTNAKPDGMLVVPKAAQVDFIQRLPIEALPGIGSSTAKALHGRGIDTVAQLGATDINVLRYWFGLGGARMHFMAWAKDPRPVEPHRTELSIGSERTFAADTRDIAEIDRMLVRMAESVAGTLRNRRYLAGSVALKVKYSDLTVTSKSRQLPSPSDDALALLVTVRDLLAQLPSSPLEFRLVGIRADRLQSRDVVGHQVTLDEAVADDGSRAATHAAVDSIRGRFGHGAVAAASGLAEPAEHIASLGR